jgi:hypothetical protein
MSLKVASKAFAERLPEEQLSPLTSIFFVLHVDGSSCVLLRVDIVKRKIHQVWMIGYSHNDIYLSFYGCVNH